MTLHSVMPSRAATRQPKWRCGHATRCLQAVCFIRSARFDVSCAVVFGGLFGRRWAIAANFTLFYVGQVTKTTPAHVGVHAITSGAIRTAFHQAECHLHDPFGIQGYFACSRAVLLCSAAAEYRICALFVSLAFASLRGRASVAPKLEVTLTT